MSKMIFRFLSFFCSKPLVFVRDRELDVSHSHAVCPFLKFYVNFGAKPLVLVCGGDLRATAAAE